MGSSRFCVQRGFVYTGLAKVLCATRFCVHWARQGFVCIEVLCALGSSRFCVHRGFVCTGLVKGLCASRFGVRWPRQGFVCTGPVQGAMGAKGRPPAPPPTQNKPTLVCYSGL